MSENAAIDWLLGEDNPPVRLQTLTHLLKRPESDPEVQATRARLMDYAVTREILAHIDEIWASGPRMFWSYKGAYWNTVYLGLFIADGHHPRIAKGLELHLTHSLVGERWQCMAACMLRALRRLGYGDHPSVVAETETLAERLLTDGGVDCPSMNTSLMPRCYMTLPKYLLCFGEIPPEQRSTTVREAIAWITQELIEHHVYIYLPGNHKAWDEVRPRSRRKSDYPEGETPESWRAKMQAQFIADHGLGELQPKRIWTRFGFPLNYNSDILEAMLALALVEAPMDERLEKALQVIRDKRTDDGRWVMEKSLNGQMWADVEIKQKPSKWLTLFATIVLDHFDRA